MKKLLSLLFILPMAVTVSKAQIEMNSSGNVTMGDFGYTGTKLTIYGNSFLYGNLGIGSGPQSSYKLFSTGNAYLAGGSPSYVVGIGRVPSYKLDVNGNIRVNSTIYSSDIRLKKNILAIDKSLDLLKNLHAISYQLVMQEEQDFSNSVSSQNKEPALSDTLSGSDNKYDQKLATVRMKHNQNRHIGFSAQDFKETFPELVYEDIDGYLGIDYVSLIPVLVEAIKEQQLMIEELQSEVGVGKVGIASQASISTTTKAEEIRNTKAIVLYQNSPNPFTKITEISYYLSEEVKNATIYLYNMEGTQLRSFPLQQKGKASITISGGELNAGMYMYALIADGKVIDTKKMILTD